MEVCPEDVVMKRNAGFEVSADSWFVRITSCYQESFFYSHYMTDQRSDTTTLHHLTVNV